MMEQRASKAEDMIRDRVERSRAGRAEQSRTSKNEAQDTIYNAKVTRAKQVDSEQLEQNGGAAQTENEGTRTKS
jgi:hypothetical protein